MTNCHTKNRNIEFGNLIKLYIGFSFEGSLGETVIS